jgi:hypothetical protein
VTSDSPAAWPAAVRDVAFALGLAGIVIAGEYVFRHFLMFWFPILGTLHVNDMVALAVFYSLLAFALGVLPASTGARSGGDSARRCGIS